MSPSIPPAAATDPRQRACRPMVQRYTLVFRNGELLRHQDLFTLAQYRSDARLQEIVPEPPWAEGTAA